MSTKKSVNTYVLQPVKRIGNLLNAKQGGEEARKAVATFLGEKSLKFSIAKIQAVIGTLPSQAIQRLYHSAQLAHDEAPLVA